ncbi:MAG: mandelate racemase/muconate lactonizing enzyme family protein [Pseudolabrys sp.]|nr:mandelate racemase/muconate lactonizing enzyme family protein [Pseudolabrys sp.]
MKIVEVRGYHVGFSPNPAIGNSRTWIRRRDFLLVEIVTDNGIRGWGEVFSSPHAAAALIQTKLTPLILGQSPLAYRRLWETMVATHGYDRRGASMMAVSAIDMALHDIAAKSLGVSVAAMLGGALRDRIFAYASGPFIAEGTDPYGQYPGIVDECLKRGYRAFKPRAGVGPRQDGEMANAMRKQVGPDVGLMVDINQGYTARAAIDSAHRMADAHLLWIEEPVQPEDITGYATVAAAVPTAIAGGEALASLAAFKDMLEARTFSIVQPDLTVCGGYTGFMRIAALCAAYDLPVMAHAFGTVVNQRAALQVSSLLPASRGGGPAAYPYIEYDVTPNPLLDLQGPVTIESDGTVSLPDVPGTGLELDAKNLEPWITKTWSQTYQ